MPNDTAIERWNFEEFHVQRELDANDFVNAASTLIAAGPPTLAAAGDSRLGDDADPAELDEISSFAYPIGVLENAAVAQNKQLQRLFEIGSKRSYFITGRNVGSVTLARTLFHGPNLLRVLYAYYPASLINPTVVNLLKTNPPDSVNQLKNNPGFADMFMNLDSDLFDHAFGLMLLFQDQLQKNYGAIYLENAYVNAHQMNISSTSVLVAEGATIQFDRAVPIDVGAVARAEFAALSNPGVSTAGPIVQ
jgi:hypothetical protein